jgi:hypothetical protein
MPRYAILLPTRNGASLLEGCVQSVLDQPYEDFELVVSDNASEDGTREILEQFAIDPRVRLLHQDEPLSVTDNWNACLAASTGERLTVIGDDDLLLPGYFERADALLKRHGQPDVLLHDGYAFAFPGFAGSKTSHYDDHFCKPASPLPTDGELSGELRRRIVESLFRFDFPLPLNMQLALVTRRALDTVPGARFRPPFPDFWAIAGMLLTVDRWVMAPERLVVIGVSPKSFGQTVHSSGSLDTARTYLGVDPQFDGQLPGSAVMNGHYETLLALQKDFPVALGGVEIDRHEYVWQQAYSWYVQFRLGSLSAADVAARLRLLRPSDWAGLARLFVKRLRPGVLKRRTQLDPDAATSTLWPGMQPVPDVADIVGFAAWIESHAPRSPVRA